MLENLERSFTYTELLSCALSVLSVVYEPKLPGCHMMSYFLEILLRTVDVLCRSSKYSDPHLVQFWCQVVGPATRLCRACQP